MESTTITRGSVVNVVIVDGAPFVRERLRALLHTNVPQVDVIGEAADAQTAIRLIRDTRPDAVILDLQLAGGSGFNVLRAVKLVPSAPIVIVLTNLTTIEYHVACLEAGAEFFLDKSFGLDLLTDILGHLARRLTSDSHEEEDEP